MLDLCRRTPARSSGFQTRTASLALAFIRRPRSTFPQVAILITLVSLGCAATPEQARNVGNKIVLTADGLERIEHDQSGTLYIKRDHEISGQHQYVLSPILMTYEHDSPRFTPKEEARMRSYVEEGVVASLLSNGSETVSDVGPCVLSIGVGMVDVEIHKPNTTGTSTSQLKTWGAVTMVVDVRDSTSGEPLLRYGRRIGIPGGVQTNDAHPQWFRVQKTLDALLVSQHKALRDIVPESSLFDPSCKPPNEPPQQTRAPRSL
jgi:hypothetical protein